MIDGIGVLLFLSGDRITKLGTNMYSIVRPSDTSISGALPKVPAATAEDVSINFCHCLLFHGVF